MDALVELSLTSHPLLGLCVRVGICRYMYVLLPSLPQKCYPRRRATLHQRRTISAFSCVHLLGASWAFSNSSVPSGRSRLTASKFTFFCAHSQRFQAANCRQRHKYGFSGTDPSGPSLATRGSCRCQWGLSLACPAPESAWAAAAAAYSAVTFPAFALPLRPFPELVPACYCLVAIRPLCIKSSSGAETCIPFQSNTTSLLLMETTVNWPMLSPGR